MASLKVLGIAGSLRKESHNRRIIELSKKLAPEGMMIEQFFLDDIPLYNMDVENAGYPESAQDLKNRVAEADGVLFAVPEHDFTFSAVIKNALEWISRPPSEKSPLVGKPVAIQSAAGGWAGGLRAQLAFKLVMNYFPCKVMNFPEVCIGSSHKKFDEAGVLNDDLAISSITKQMEAFKEFILSGK